MTSRFHEKHDQSLELGSMVRKPSRRPRPPPAGDSQLAGWSLSIGDGLGSVEAMTKPASSRRTQDPGGEQVRRLRLRADGLRSPAVNLRETILLTRKLFELRDAARRAR